MDWLPEFAEIESHEIENAEEEAGKSENQSLVVLSKNAKHDKVKSSIRNFMCKIFREKCAALSIPTSYKFGPNTLAFMFATASDSGSMRKTNMQKQGLFKTIKTTVCAFSNFVRQFNSVTMSLL